MKLQAVTVCINYADYLECIAANRRHFDKWVIVTVKHDHRTIAVCKRFNLEYVISRVLRRDGKDFHAAYNKARVVNEGLVTLDQEGWVVVLDADVYLPRHFRDRLTSLPLTPGILYGMSGRKVCADYEMFEMLRECEPWDRFCERHSAVIGYFNLFSLEHTNNRYPETNRPCNGIHDDYLFFDSFGYGNHAVLPLTVIHTGPPSTNWSGRVAGAFVGRLAVQKDCSVIIPVRRVELPAGIDGTAAVIGYYPGMDLARWAGPFDRLYLVDHFQVHCPSADPTNEANRQVLRRLWAEEHGTEQRFTLLGVHSARNIDQIPDNSLDLLYLSGEVTPDWLVPALPHWERKLKDGAIVCGDLFGLPHWPDSTYAISLMIGVPDFVAASGFWWTRVQAKHLHCGTALTKPDNSPGSPVPCNDRHRGLLHIACDGKRGIVYINVGAEHLATLLISMYSLRQHWTGAIAIYHWGEDQQSLRIAAARCAVMLYEVGSDTLYTEDILNARLEEVLAISPSDKAIYLPSATVVTGPVEKLFEPADGQAKLEASRPLLASRSGGAVAIRQLVVDDARDFLGIPDGSGPLLLCQGLVEQWTEAALQAWSIAQARTISALAAPIRVPRSTTIIVIVGTDDVGDFEHVWLSLKFASDVPVLLVCIDLEPDDLWLEGNEQAAHFVRLSENALSSPGTLINVVLENIATENVVFIPPIATPMPGAELFTHYTLAPFDAVVHRRGNTDRNQKSFIRIPAPLFGKVRTKTLLKIAERSKRQPASAPSFSEYMGHALKQVRAKMAFVDQTTRGWNITPPAAPPKSLHPE